MYHSPITLNRPPWLAWLLPDDQPPAPAPDPVPASIRAELDLLASEIQLGKLAQQQLQNQLDLSTAEHNQTKASLALTRAELEQERAYGKQQARNNADLRSMADTHEKILGNMQATVMALSGNNAALEESLRRLEADDRVKGETIVLLRERLHTMEAELKVLQDERGQHIGQIQGQMLAITEYKQIIDRVDRRLAAAGLPGVYSQDHTHGG